MPNLAEIQGYIASKEEVSAGDYYASIKIEEQKEDTFVAHLALRERDSGQRNLIKFTLGIGQDTPSQGRSVHNQEEPHFVVDYYKREEQRGSKAYFTLHIHDEKHLLECIKGTIVILKEFLERIDQAKNINLSYKLLYKDAIESELIGFKPMLIDVLYESFRNEQLIVRVNRTDHKITTKHNFQKYLDLKETQPIYLPLLKKIEENKNP